MEHDPKQFRATPESVLLARVQTFDHARNPRIARFTQAATHANHEVVVLVIVH
jgi:hypothetical protein